MVLLNDLVMERSPGIVVNAAHLKGFLFSLSSFSKINKRLPSIYVYIYIYIKYIFQEIYKGASRFVN